MIDLRKSQLLVCCSSSRLAEIDLHMVLSRWAQPLHKSGVLEVKLAFCFDNIAGPLIPATPAWLLNPQFMQCLASAWSLVHEN